MAAPSTSTERGQDDVAPQLSPLREKLWRIIFLSDTRAGRAFDVVLLAVIAASVVVVMLESVPDIAARHARLLRAAEWVVTALFTLELVVRLWVVRRPLRYLTSFFGVIDVLSIVPSYLELFFDGTRFLLVVRVLRLLRLFRILKMAHHLGEASVLLAAVRASRHKIVVFLFSVCTLVCVEGTLVYLVEHDVNEGLSSIPQAMYWAVVTLTTVGYGDVTPVTVAGKLFASVVMLTGFAIIAVPTGIVSAELGRHMRSDERACRECGLRGHDPRARFCRECGTSL